MYNLLSFAIISLLLAIQTMSESTYKYDADAIQVCLVLYSLYYTLLQIYTSLYAKLPTIIN